MIITKSILIYNDKFQFGEVFIMAMWNPWRGCKKCSDGCLHCYIHKKYKLQTKDLCMQARLAGIDYRKQEFDEV